MSQFGGQSQYGEASFGGDPYGLSPTFALERMLAELAFLQTDATGPIRTLGLRTNDLGSAIQNHALGLPALLVGYDGADYRARDVGKVAFEQTATYNVLCIADSLRGRDERAFPGSVYQPGLFNLMRWAAVYGGRALNRIARNAGPTSERIIAWGDSYFAGLVEFTATFSLCLPATIETPVDHLRKLGIVHTPSDLDNLFAGDNVTPNTDDPTGYGVAPLKED